jgi:hypothetical protein
VHAALVAHGVPRARRVALGLASLAVAAAIWLPLIHLFFRPAAGDFQPAAGISPFARALAARHLALWTDPTSRESELRRMRSTNAEWDFMGRTFLVLALANISLRAPDEAPANLAVIDTIIAETVRLERERGVRWFLMDYAQVGQFRSGVDRSLFVDGEVALMIGARRLVAERADLGPLMRERIDALLGYMGPAPVLCGESYPDECWMFCNAVALAALRVDEALGGPDHEAFIAAWLERARARLVDPKTGLLVSSFRYDGEPLDGPEGSSIFMVVHCLAVVDPAFARDQWERARRELLRGALGFGWAAEWPASWRGARDVDSGPVVPLLDVSPGASGMAFLGAATFGDRATLDALATTLRFAAFPTRRGDALRFSASNQVGDAVLLYSAVMGPLWEKVEHARAR